LAKIVFTWEIGAGTGHITPYLKLIQLLEADGHHIFFIIKSSEKAQSLFRHTRVTWLQAPITSIRPVTNIKSVDSYPKILGSSGYDKPEYLASKITAWRNLFTLIDPDLLIFDYSPTAMLASRGINAKGLAIGTGFHLPPNITPLPGFSDELDWMEVPDPDELQAFEHRILNNVNNALSMNGLSQISQLTELLQADKTILRTLPELDHYSNRPATEYAGIFMSSKGERPVWPKLPGPKIFAYLKPFQTLPAFLESLNQKRYPTLLYGDKLPPEIEHTYASETLHFIHRPLHMDSVGKEADIGVCNANHGTTAELLLSGVPVLMLPLHSEQYLVAKNVEHTGAGLSAPLLRPKGMALKLDTLINNTGYKTSAQKFAERYRDFSSDKLTNSMLEAVTSLL